MAKLNRWYPVLALIAAAPLTASAGQVLTLDDYLKQVEEGHGGLKGARATAVGGIDAASEADLFFSPQLSLSAGYANDHREPLLNFSPTNTSGTQYVLAVSELTPFGLQSKLSYTFSPKSTQGSGVTPPQYTDAALEADLTFSLWRNFLGSESRAQKAAARAGDEATGYGNLFQASQIRAEAESSYWRLAAARESVTAQREALESAKRLREWNASRVQRHLGDEADLYQAESALAARRLQLQAAEDEERAAARKVQSMRAATTEKVEEDLSLPDPGDMAGIKVPERKQVRADVLAARAQYDAAGAAAQLGLERNRPTVEAFAQLSTNGHSLTSGDQAISKSLTTQYPYNTVGVRLSLPFDQFSAGTARSGYSRQVEGAQMSYERKLREGEELWIELNHKVDDAKHELTLATALEGIQRRKLEHERDRLKSGRTTTFQVINFEQDYATARLSRIAAQAGLLNLVALLKTFAEGGSL
ncbi:MAG TPA: TolC family protein [Bdellovibrionota bacterium]|jgi:outer membrane protein TolC|nr:TolC family protein [Bdellovibrionota bacterium]